MLIQPTNSYRGLVRGKTWSPMASIEQCYSSRLMAPETHTAKRALHSPFTDCTTGTDIQLEHQETQRNVSPSEQEEEESGPMPTSAINDLLKKWEAVRAMVLEWHPNQANVSRVGDLYNDNAINYFRKILKKREKQSTLDMFFNAP
ncbi:uncharacterized protein TNCV_3290871 [Trichonephila clavipes]|nr:uncharacterized protein TNCV_3290871 [Trichonephila clavipes]